MDKTRLVKRRDFLKGSASSLAAAAALPAIIPAGVLGAQDRPAPSDRVVVGVIGVGGLGRNHHLANKLLPEKRFQVAAVCDVDADHRNEAARICRDKAGIRVGVYEDFRELLERKDIDAVVIAVPDHWHTLIAMAACEAGKDVYCEKPLTYAIDEGKKLVAAARRYGTVFQTGSQQRSDRRFRQACELVRNGRIGKIKQIDTVLHGVPSGDWQPYQTPPSNLNWNFWLGPAPYADYMPNRCHYQFRWFLDYSGGVMTDWGAHHNDIAQWGLGMDHSGPVEVDGREVTWAKDGPHTVALHFDVKYRYDQGTELICHTDEQTINGYKFGNGVMFSGTSGWIFVNRSEIKASDPDLLKTDPGPDDVRLFRSPGHHENWLDCIRTRERCICDVEIGHRSVSVCHIGNISMRLGRPLKWDPAKEEFVGDAAANQLRFRPMRGPWHL